MTPGPTSSGWRVPERFGAGGRLTSVMAKQTTVSRPQIGPDVEVFHEPEATVVWSASHQFAFGRPVSAVGEQPVDQYGENEVGEHVHGGLPEHGSPASAYL